MEESEADNHVKQLVQRALHLEKETKYSESNDLYFEAVRYFLEQVAGWLPSFT